MKVVFLSTLILRCHSLRGLLRAGHQVALVITQPDRPAGRGQQERPSPVKELASQFGLPILQPQDVNSAESLAAIGEVDPDAIVVAAFGQKLGEAILKMPPWLHQCACFFASPAGGGQPPIQRAIMAGDQTTGVTIMLMDEGWDTGDIICQQEVPIEADEAGGSLHDKLAEEGAKLLLEALADLAASKVVPQPQDHQKAVMAPKLTKEEQ